MKLPSFAAPATTRMTPAMRVAITRPSKPCREMTLATTTTKAPVGPPIWVRLPPSMEISRPATTTVTSPVSGAAPEAMASAMARGRATMATVRPARASLRRSPSP